MINAFGPSARILTASASSRFVINKQAVSPSPAVPGSQYHINYVTYEYMLQSVFVMVEIEVDVLEPSCNLFVCHIRMYVRSVLSCQGAETTTLASNKNLKVADFSGINPTVG